MVVKALIGPVTSVLSMLLEECGDGLEERHDL